MPKVINEILDTKRGWTLDGKSKLGGGSDPTVMQYFSAISSDGRYVDFEEFQNIVSVSWHGYKFGRSQGNQRFGPLDVSNEKRQLDQFVRELGVPWSFDEMEHLLARNQPDYSEDPMGYYG